MDFLSAHAFHFKRQRIQAKGNEKEELSRKYDPCGNFSGKNVPPMLFTRAGIWHPYYLDYYITSFGILKKIVLHICENEI